MITKPEDAKPRMCAWDRSEPSGVIAAIGFTAKECAEIARAYAEICGAYINATNKEKEQAADDEMSRWEAKFAEWEGK